MRTGGSGSSTVSARIRLPAAPPRAPAAGGRPSAFDAEACKRRNVVERCFNAELTIAAITLWLR